jgi:hypothetical protein
MGNNYLQGLIEKLETLLSAIAIGNREDINQARKNLEQHVGSFNQFVNFLRKQQSLHGCQNDCTYQAIDWCSDALRKHKRPYPGLWDGLATKEFIAELKRWAASGGEKTDLAKVPISELIKQGESHPLEFKETLEYDTHQSQGNKDVLHSSLKTIAGFLNAKGGTMLIGVDDLGKIRGIERDLSIMNRGNNDRFEQKIRNCLKDRFKPQPIGKVNISFEKFTEGMICRVDVQTSKEIVHLDNEVYVRDGNTTQKLEGQPLTDWVQQRSN